MKMIRSYSGAAFLAAYLVLPVFPAHTAVVVVAPTISSLGSLTITQDITFTITTTVSGDNIFHFVLDNWVTYDGDPTLVTYSPNLLISKNGGAPQTYSSGELLDNYGTNPSAILTPGDGYFNVSNTPALAVNDTLTLKAGTYTLGEAPTQSFNPQATQTFTGNMFVFDNNSNIISNTVAVPEPSSAAFLGLGLPAVLGTLRKRRCAT